MVTDGTAGNRALTPAANLGTLATVASCADSVTSWLMAGDPAIRWQAMRDLGGAADEAVERERARVARAGWGRLLLMVQDESGQWGGGLSLENDFLKKALSHAKSILSTPKPGSTKP